MVDAAQGIKVFLLLFFQKKKVLAFFIRAGGSGFWGAGGSGFRLGGGRILRGLRR